VSPTKVAMLGAGFIADIHLESFARFVPDAHVTALYSRTAERAERIAKHWHVPQWFTDIDELIAKADCEVVDICVPNFLHHRAVVAAARAGKHVIVEKPLCVTLEEADDMIAVCRQHGRKLMYAEELCFAPKYERIRHLAKEGAVGDIYMLKQLEKHSGPHSDWFWNIDQSGGGVLMDMGCHAFGWFRWMLGGAPVVKSVWATLDTVRHKGRTRGEDNGICIVEFENGVIGLAEDSWAKPGGMDDRIEVYGTKGVSFADLFRGNSASTYSEEGYNYAAEKAGSTQGWTFTIFEEVFNQGYPHELQHFIQCVRENEPPLVTGEDGRAVLEIIYAAYASARSGAKVMLPFHPKVSRPIDLWLG
jgi:myo-inositol 2-dehydrogenase / D-chiro-inositol 1-dehydrogenase